MCASAQVEDAFDSASATLRGRASLAYVTRQSARVMVPACIRFLWESRANSEKISWRRLPANDNDANEDN
jgi:hypothetical protein